MAGFSKPRVADGLPVFYIDGQSVGNEQRAGTRRARIVVAYKEEPSSVFKILSENIGDKTNNEAEYQALLKALSIVHTKWADPKDGGLRKEVGHVRICSDSELLVKQLKGEYDVKDLKLRGLWERARDMMKRMSSVVLEWLPREENFAGQWLENKWQGGKFELVRDG